MLTDLQQQSLTAAHELGARVPEIGTGGWEFRSPSFTHDPPEWISSDFYTPSTATQEHYDAACWRLALSLMRAGYYMEPADDGRTWFVCHYGNKRIFKEIPVRDPLAAQVAACKEILQ